MGKGGQQQQNFLFFIIINFVNLLFIEFQKRHKVHVNEVDYCQLDDTNVWQTVRRINVWILGGKGLM